MDQLLFCDNRAMHNQAKDDDVDSLFDNPSTPDTEHEFDAFKGLPHEEEEHSGLLLFLLFLLSFPFFKNIENRP